VTPVKWIPLKYKEDELDYLNIDVKLEMKSFRKGKERWDWGKKK
jgi:hypothetical protein